FSVLYNQAGTYSKAGAPGLGFAMYSLLIIGLLNTVISLVYYFNVFKVMVLETPIEEPGAPAPTPVPSLDSFYAGVLAFAVLALGILWGPLADQSARGAAPFGTQTLSAGRGRTVRG